MAGLRNNEGYLLLDHSQSPGLPEEALDAMGLPTNVGRAKLECPTYTCSHCQRVVILNPLRSRERAYCPKCHHNICDWCEAERVKTGVCRPFEQVIEDTQEAASRLILPGA